MDEMSLEKRTGTSANSIQPAPTRLSPDRQAEILELVRLVSLYVQTTRPAGAADEIGSAVLAQLIGSDARLIRGQVGFVACQPDAGSEENVHCFWITPAQCPGYWVEVEDHIVDAFADERMREKDPAQTRSWLDLPIVFRSFDHRTTSAAIEHQQGRVVDIAPRHEAHLYLFNAWRLEAGNLVVTPIRPKCVLSNRSRQWISAESRWAHSTLVAGLRPDLAAPPPPAQSTMAGMQAENVKPAPSLAAAYGEPARVRLRPALMAGGAGLVAAIAIRLADLFLF